ncbi:MAG: DnaJ domain-containing protein [Acidobacteriota bacterium]
MEQENSTGRTKALAEVVRSVYLGRFSGLVEVELGEEPTSLFFRKGELHLDRDDPTALRISPLLAASGDRTGAESDLGHAMEELATELSPNPAVQARFRKDHALVVELVGPLPTALFVQELATLGCDETQLLERLGGVDVKLRSSAKTPALDQLPGLEPDMAKVLVTLAQPATPADLLRGAGADRLTVLRGLVKLWSVGLVCRVRGDSAGQLGEEILSPRVLEQFSARIAETLNSDPLDLPPEEHRERIASLLSRLGEMNFYQLLGIDPRGGEEEVFAAYSRLARIVHPSHSVRLGLEGKEVASRVIFEKATEAYLTLSDPRRRASYNTVAGVHVQVQVDQEQRKEEKKAIALQNYRRAASCLSQMDFSLAVDLLKEATRMDPQAEYFARLGMAQSKNPNWHRHALESYRKASELAPEDAGIRVGYAELLEEMERPDEARNQYREALRLMPDHEHARQGLERLGGGLSGLAPKVGGFRSLFARGSDKASG